MTWGSLRVPVEVACAQEVPCGAKTLEDEQAGRDLGYAYSWQTERPLQRPCLRTRCRPGAHTDPALERRMVTSV